MTKVAIVADVHVANHRRFGGPFRAGINSRCELALDTLREAVATANGLECEAFVVAGDLLDSVNPSPQVVAATMKVLSRFNGERFVMRGNHEMASEHPGDHSLSPFFPVAYIVDSSSLAHLTDALLVLIPYQSGPSSTWLEREVDALFSRLLPITEPVLACLHLGLEGETTPEFLRGAEDSVQATELARILEKHRVSYAALGNWHETKFARHAGVQMLQVGTLCPTGFSNHGFSDYGAMAIWDSGKGSLSSIRIPGPRFVQVSSENELEDALGVAASGCSIFVEWSVEPGDVASAKERLSKLREEGKIVDGEIRVRREGQEREAHVAASAVSSAENLDESLSSFVDGMQLPEGVDKSSVLEESRRYLKRGRV